MKRLKNRKKTPPRGWRFVDPDTGFRFRRRYQSLEELEEHVKRYRRMNNLEPIPHLPEVIQNWLCSHPGMAAHCVETTVKSRTLRQYLEGAKAAAKVYLQGVNAFVSQEVAESRAEMCSNCKFNKKNEHDNRAQKYTDKYVESLVGDRETGFDENLFSCSVCSCPLRPKVHFDQKIIEDALTREEKEVLAIPIRGFDGKKFKCWQVKPVKV